MTTAQKREAWRQYCRKTLELFNIEIHETPSGAVRLIGLHGDITCTDLADMTKGELSALTRIRT